jgi:hypothetical protein
MMQTEFADDILDVMNNLLQNVKLYVIKVVALACMALSK